MRASECESESKRTTLSFQNFIASLNSRTFTPILATCERARVCERVCARE